MIFSVLASFAVALLSGMGVGGGGLFVVFLAIFTDIPQIAAQGMNLLFFLFSSGSAVCVHLSKRRIFGSAVIAMSLFGVLGAAAGSLLCPYIPSGLLRKLFGIMLAVSGVISLSRSFSAEETKRRSR